MWPKVVAVTLQIRDIGQQLVIGLRDLARHSLLGFHIEALGHILDQSLKVKVAAAVGGDIEIAKHPRALGSGDVVGERDRPRTKSEECGVAEPQPRIAISASLVVDGMLCE